MEIIDLDQDGDATEPLSTEQIHSIDPLDPSGISGDPLLNPRIGDQYQVDIPDIISAPDYIFYLKGTNDVGNKDLSQCDLSMSSVIPDMFINKDTEKKENEKLEVSCYSTDSFNRGAPSEVESVNNLWSDIEKSSFLLGLYIFGKNFVQLQRFVASKKIGDIQSFYYTDFFKSSDFNRWSTCRKMRTRKCVYGEKLFTGFRQQELISRLLPQVSDECQKALLEVSKTYGEGQMCLEDYVSSLKVMVGMVNLVDAVAIGKGKRDLTSTAIEPVKSNQVIHRRPEAYSSLTPTEIVKFLNGNFRLSKARSNDLFWEAVWPRLLARGWHSEQPRNQAYVAGSKHSLVFLVPGVKKFSRRRLVKGDHYFDSVTDVLSKVGSDPGLLELENEENYGNKNEENDGEKNKENGWENEIKEQEYLPERQRHCYLLPRTPSNDADTAKFTVVDTSLADGKPFKIKELSTLPTEILGKKSSSEDSNQAASEVSIDEPDCTDAMLVDQIDTPKNTLTNTLSDGGKINDREDLHIISSDEGVRMNCPDSPKPAIDAERREDVYKDMETRKEVKSHLSRRPLEKSDLDYSVSTAKRQRTLTACWNEEMNSGTKTFHSVPRPGNEVPNLCSEGTDIMNNAVHVSSSPRRRTLTSNEEPTPDKNSLPLVPRVGDEVPSFCSEDANMTKKDLTDEVGYSQDRSPITNSSKAISPESIVGDPEDNHYHGLKHPENTTQPRIFVDLNSPQLPQDCEDGVPMEEGVMKGQEDLASKQNVDLSAPKTLVMTSEQQDHMNSRRQSTRNRPPTARALEALVNGYLTSNRRRKKEANARGTSKNA